jgi:hypothetical protein
MGMPAEERRRFPRVRVPAEQVAVTLATSAPVQVLDVSESGMLVLAAQPVSVGRRGRLDVRLGDDPVSLEVEVQRVETDRQPGGAGPYTVGIEYVQLSGELRRRIADFLRTD